MDDLVRDKINRRLSNKHGIPKKVIEKATDSQFSLVAKIMKEGNFDTIQLPFFGKFKVDKRRVRHVNAAAKKKKENEKNG